MSVTFDEEQQITRAPQSRASGLYGLVIRWGFAKNEKGASAVLLVATGIMINQIFVFLSLCVFYKYLRLKFDELK